MARAESVSELTLLVRTPGNWGAFKAFTEEQRGEAEAWATQHGGTIQELP